MEDDSENIAVVLILVLLLLTLIIGSSVGCMHGKDIMKDEAVLYGHGEWAVDDSGTRRFKWRSHANED